MIEVGSKWRKDNGHTVEVVSLDYPYVRLKDRHGEYGMGRDWFLQTYKPDRGESAAPMPDPNYTPEQLEANGQMTMEATP